MLPPPRVGGIELTSGSSSVPASSTVATAIRPANGETGQDTLPFRPTGNVATGVPPRPLPNGVKVETLPYLMRSPVARPSVETGGMTSWAVSSPSGVRKADDSAPLPCRLEMTP
jgi:hypothetical protein